MLNYTTKHSGYYEYHNDKIGIVVTREEVVDNILTMTKDWRIIVCDYINNETLIQADGFKSMKEAERSVIKFLQTI